MKKISRLLFPLILAVLCTGIIGFLHTFTVTHASMQYIDWHTAVKVGADGSEIPLGEESFLEAADLTSVYYFTGTLPENLGEGCLLFEITGEELELSLNGEVIYSSSAAFPENATGLSQARVLLPENATGELTMTCKVLDPANALFPPLLRFIPSTLEDVEPMAYANLFGIPAGAAAAVLLLTAVLFLLGLFRKSPDWSLIPLFFAVLGLLFYRIVQSCGYFFLPEEAVRFLTWRGFAWLAPGALAIYLLMNRRRSFWRLLGLITAWSAGILLVLYLISRARNGYLALYLDSSVKDLFQSGYYDGLLSWFTIWLSFAAAFLSAYHAVVSFADQQSETQAIQLKNQLIQENYQTLQKKLRDSAALRHEFRHQLTALYALYRIGDYEGLGALLEDLKQQDAKTSPAPFSKNIAMNAILQDSAARAAKAGISFSVHAAVPENLSIPESDLCILLMNMLDNALEACAVIKAPKKRWIRFQAEIRNGCLAVKCENPYDTEPGTDRRGRLKSSKADAASHGFGISQMSAVAKRYGSLLDISFTEDHICIVQTALKLPGQKNH